MTKVVKVRKKASQEKRITTFPQYPQSYYNYYLLVGIDVSERR